MIKCNLCGYVGKSVGYGIEYDHDSRMCSQALLSEMDKLQSENEALSSDYGKIVEELARLEGECARLKEVLGRAYHSNLCNVTMFPEDKTMLCSCGISTFKHKAGILDSKNEE